MTRVLAALLGIIAISSAIGSYVAYTQTSGPPPAPRSTGAAPPGPQEKATTQPLPEGVEASPAPPVEPIPALAPLPDVPAASSPPSGVVCPPDWPFFDNPVVGYSICYPPGWGLTDFARPTALSVVPGETLYSVNILSAGGFPYPADLEAAAPDVKARIESSVVVTISVFPPGASREGCKPETTRVVAAVKAAWCEDTYDILPGPEVKFSSDGGRHTLVLLVPLAAPPQLDPETPPELIKTRPTEGFQLYITVSGPTSGYIGEDDLQWKIVDQIRLR